MKICFRWIPAVVLCLFSTALAGRASETLEGVVIGPGDTPVDGAQVEICGFKSVWYVQMGEPILTQTDPNGHFSVAVEPADFRVALAHKNGLSCGWKPVQTGQSSFSIQLTEPAPFGGQVVDEAGKPIAGANAQIILLSKVQTRDGRGDPLTKVDDFKLSSKIFSAKTDAQGRFTISALPAGAGFDIGIHKDGYVKYSSFMGSWRYAYTAGTTGHQFILEPEAVLAGQVVDIKTGDAVSGFPVKIISYSKGGYDPFYKETKTDLQGRFSFGGLPANQYTLYFDDGNQSYLHETQTVTLIKGQHKTDLQVRLSKGETLEVNVIDAATQRPIEKAAVEVLCKAGKHKTKLITDASGQARKQFLLADYTITEVEAEGYRRDTVEHPLSIEAGKTPSITLTLEEYPRLEGVIVRPDGTPAADITVHLLHGFTRDDPNPTPVQTGLKKGPKIPWSVQTDSTGRFVFWLVAAADELEDKPGVYPVFAYSTGQNLFVADKVPFGLTNTRLTLKPGLKVVGSVLDQHGDVVREGAVDLRVIYQTGPNRSSASMSVKPGHDGQFEFAGVPTDAQGLSLAFYDFTNEYKSFKGKVDPSQARDGVVQLQPITVQRADVVVRGRVLLPDGSPVMGANVSAMDYHAGYDNDTTDKQGRFELTLFNLPSEITAGKNIPPGGYYSGKAADIDKDKDVIITLRSADDKETFLPVISPQRNSNQTENRQEPERRKP